ncbi:MAG: ArsR/SmtB family transcription factor [Enterovibrio sp.]
MNKNNATKIFESLSSPVRLDVWRILIKAGLEGMVAGELANKLNIAPNTLSFHLKAMLYADLVSVEQEGRFLRYRANIPLMVDLINYLTEECCSAHPEQCLSLCSCANCKAEPAVSLHTDKATKTPS